METQTRMKIGYPSRVTNAEHQPNLILNQAEHRFTNASRKLLG